MRLVGRVDDAHYMISFSTYSEGVECVGGYLKGTLVDPVEELPEYASP